MPNPTQLLVPGADFSASPPLWVLPTSVQPSYVGMFGANANRSLANLAAYGLPPSVPTGEMPAIQPGWMTTQGWNATTSKQAGLALPVGVIPGNNYTLFWVGRVSGGTYGPVVPVLTDPLVGSGSIIIDYYAANNLTFRQKTTSTLIQTSSPTLVGSSTAWQAFCGTGQSGVGINLYVMTNNSPSVVTGADVNAFTFSPQLFVGGGGGTTASLFQGAGDLVLMIFFPSVLSAADRAVLYAWAKNYVAKFGITI